MRRRQIANLREEPKFIKSRFALYNEIKKLLNDNGIDGGAFTITPYLISGMPKGVCQKCLKHYPRNVGGHQRFCKGSK